MKGTQSSVFARASERTACAELRLRCGSPPALPCGFTAQYAEPAATGFAPLAGGFRSAKPAADPAEAPWPFFGIADAI
jgi:hypothetical protein